MSSIKTDFTYKDSTRLKVKAWRDVSRWHKAKKEYLR